MEDVTTYVTTWLGPSHVRAEMAMSCSQMENDASCQMVRITCLSLHASTHYLYVGMYEFSV